MIISLDLQRHYLNSKANVTKFKNQSHTGKLYQNKNFKLRIPFQNANIARFSITWNVLGTLIFLPFNHHCGNSSWQFSPRYNHLGWLGIKKHVTYFLQAAWMHTYEFRAKPKRLPSRSTSPSSSFLFFISSRYWIKHRSEVCSSFKADGSISLSLHSPEPVQVRTRRRVLVLTAAYTYQACLIKQRTTTNPYIDALNRFHKTA